MAHDVDAMLDGVYDKLSAVQTAGTFYDDLSGRIYRTLAPDDAVEPLCVIALVSDIPDRSLNSVEDIDALVDVSLYGAKGVSEATIMATHKKLLAFDGDALTITGYNAAKWIVEDRVADLVIDDKRVEITATFRIFANE